MVVIDIDAFDGTVYDYFVKIAPPVVSSLSFATKRHACCPGPLAREPRRRSRVPTERFDGRPRHSV